MSLFSPRGKVWASANRVEDLAEAARALAGLAGLSCVYLEHNPVAVTLGDAAYRAELKELLPSLTQIDATRA